MVREAETRVIDLKTVTNICYNENDHIHLNSILIVSQLDLLGPGFPLRWRKLGDELYPLERLFCMEEFIFGDLSNTNNRFSRIRAAQMGVTHLSRRDPLDPMPDDLVEVEMTVGPDFLDSQAYVYWSTDEQDPEGEFGTASHGAVTAMDWVETIWRPELWGYVRTYRAVLPAQPAGTVVRYRMSLVVGEDEREVFADNGQYYAYYVDCDEPPEWSRDAIIYQIFVDRFSPGGGRTFDGDPLSEKKLGGTINGITEKLDYLQDLGINTLWLTPIFESPSYHRYDTTNYYEVDPDLGTNQDFDRLIQEAHQRRMRVLLDCVPNHVSNRHPAFQDAQRDQESAYLHWFRFVNWPDEYATFFGVNELPQLNLRDPGAKEHILEAMAYWLRKGVDGFRVDYVLGPSIDFWADFRQMTRAVQPESWTFGEAVDMPDAQRAFGNGMDGCLDFILLEAMRNTFAAGRWSAPEFASFLSRHFQFFPESFSLPSFLDNHDMNRFSVAAGGSEERVKLAAFCQFTLPGQPIIYYGSEVNLGQPGDMVQADGNKKMVYARQPMNWDEVNLEFFEFYQSLIQMRKQLRALRRGDFKVISATEHILTYQRDDLRIVMNLGAVEDEIQLECESYETMGVLGNISLANRPDGVLIFLDPFSAVLMRCPENEVVG
ncbi:MAG: hypothetical protein JW750_06035 [Anaerolineaceae bacterium]|nr:hypothetical protein [Anaerolineaceae bacterium]